MRVRRGDIVVLPIAFTTGSGGKVRPALVVQSDHNDARLDATIVAIITKTTHRATTEATQLLIDVNSPEGQRSGLLHTSAVKCEHLITVSMADISRVIGSLSPAAMMRIDACLINEFRLVIQDKTKTNEERRFALRFLIHCIEDMHQPCHVGENKDKGGNQTQVRFVDKGTHLATELTAAWRTTPDWVKPSLAHLAVKRFP